MIANTEKLAKALKRMGTHEVRDLIALVDSGAMQLFAAGESCLFTQVVDFPRARVLELFLVVGELKDVNELERQASNFAASVNVDFIRTFGRPGWSKVLRKPKGWHKTAEVWQKDLH